jgi:hypothetical protein
MTLKLSTALSAVLLLALGSQPVLAKKKEATPPAAAAATSGPTVPGVAVASVDFVAASADAKRAADAQRPISLKVHYDDVNGYRNQLANQLKPLYDKIERDSKLPDTPANRASLQNQAATIQQIEQRGEQELNRRAIPIVYSQEYVKEQIEEKLGEAIRIAMTAKNITLVLKPQALEAFNGQAYNLEPTILAELNRLIPTANMSPPAGWEPRQIRQARAQQAAQQAAAQGQPAPGVAPAPAPAAPAPAPRPAGPQPEGR